MANSRAIDALKAQYADSPGLIDLLAESVRGQHNSALERGVAVAEGAAFRLVLWIHSQPLLCQCCGHNLIATPNYWWSGQPCNIATPEAKLIDRMCMVMIGDQILLNFQSNGQLRTSLQDLTRPEVCWYIAMRPGKRRALDKNDEADALLDQAEKLKASVRAKVEHPFRVVKRQFGFIKVRYRGLKKNTAQLMTLFALSNLWMSRGKLMGLGA